LGLLGSRYDYGLIYGKKIHETRNGLSATLPYWNRTHLSSFGKVNGIAEDLTWEIFRDTLIEQAEQGVSYFTYSWRVVALYSFNRRTGHRNCFSWRIHHGKVVFVSSQNFLYFEDICEILKQYDVAFLLETAYVQDRLPMLMTQLNLQNETLGELSKIAYKHDVQVLLKVQDMFQCT
jgi:phosphomethylpyrimidine synthase